MSVSSTPLHFRRMSARLCLRRRGPSRMAGCATCDRRGGDKDRDQETAHAARRRGKRSIHGCERNRVRGIGLRWAHKVLAQYTSRYAEIPPHHGRVCCASLGPTLRASTNGTIVESATCWAAQCSAGAVRDPDLAHENFCISGIELHEFPTLVAALATVKEAAALANLEMKLLDRDIVDAICQTAGEIREGMHHEYFRVDMIQGGAGTSSNMNTNEVMANRALEILGGITGSTTSSTPNNHLNLSQSTNDVYPPR